MSAPRVRDLFQNRGFSRYFYFHCINIWIIKIHSRVPRWRNCMLGFCAHKKTTLWTWCNRWPSTGTAVSITAGRPSPPATLSRSGVEKVSKNCNTNIIQYRVVMCRGTVIWFLFDVFLTARAASLRHNLWSAIFISPANRVYACHSISKANFWVMGFAVVRGKIHISCVLVAYVKQINMQATFSDIILGIESRRDWSWWDGEWVSEWARLKVKAFTVTSFPSNAPLITR